MPFSKGVSGNAAGRPKQTPEQKKDREHFKRLLKASTVPALESIIAISQDRFSKDRFNACRFIIDRAYGANTALLSDGAEETEPIIIKVVSRRKGDEDWEREWDDTPDHGEGIDI